ncbi:TraB/GumN family protein, partial [Aeromonas hydrophila]|uniref:TraB/GumN family protein n=1 Tax=Aeromonas hydrophila TaxID=644 RepID=UPI0038D0A9EC
MRFHRTLFAFLLCLLLPLHAFADPAFYRVSKGNQQHWLLGSIHAGKPALYPLPEPMERAWLQSRALVMEVDMTHISQEQWQEMGAITRLVDGKTLKDHLPIDLYRRTLIAAGQNGLNESMLAPLRP